MKPAIRIFLAIWLAFVLALLCAVVLTDKASLHQALTLGWLSHCSADFVAAQDVFFRYITLIGAWMPYAVAAALLFCRVGDALFVLLSQGAVALLVQPIKYMVAAPRPSLFFAQNMPEISLHRVAEVPLHLSNSFPSGHTASAFALMLALTFVFRRNRWLAALFALLAVLAGYSRIYLSQHFAEDVCAGAVIGVTATLVVAALWQRRQYAWQRQPLWRLFKTPNS